ncbi:MAG: DUF3810 domain-containing protein [Candidatus Aminicenantes bacterium]|nr:DUF3810 domain-containing protein [Candidatus Aminicenantes bacterium]
MTIKGRLRRSLGWISFGLGMIALRVAVNWVPGVAEDMYGRGVFPLIRLVLDNTLGLLPLPAVYVLIPLLCIWLIRRRRLRRNEISSRSQRMGMRVLSTLAFLFAAAGLFLILWGFNYARIPLRHQLALPLDPLEGKVLIGELEQAAAGLNQWVQAASFNSTENLEERVRAAMAGTLQSMDWPAVGRPRVRVLYPGALLKAFGVSGIYNPFTGAATIAAGLPPPSRPFLMAHELAHAWGVTDEGEANLVAFLACTRNADAEMAYSAYLAWWEYLAGPVSGSHAKAFSRISARLLPRVREDQAAIRAHWRQYSGRLMRAARQVNNMYLRSQGLAAGVISYDSFPALLRAWRRTRRAGPAISATPAGSGVDAVEEAGGKTEE